MQRKPVTIEVGQGVGLEGEFANPEKARGAALVLHPHPLYGGDMHDNVVAALAQGAADAGWAALKINFRGVGASTGRHDEGRGEVEDALAAVQWLEQQTAAPIALLGYSFGALVGSHAAGKLTGLAAGFWVAPPLVMGDMSPWPGDAGPLAIAAGDADGFTRMERLKAYVDDLGARGRLEPFEDGDHFFWGNESALAAIARDLLNNAAK